jgi:hypothetical protein
MSLNEQLEQMREASWGRWPAEKRAIVEKSFRDIAASGIFNRMVKPGDRAPDFALRKADGTEVSLNRLLHEGPVVLAFYRGHW